MGGGGRKGEKEGEGEHSDIVAVKRTGDEGGLNFSALIFLL